MGFLHLDRCEWDFLWVVLIRDLFRNWKSQRHLAFSLIGCVNLKSYFISFLPRFVHPSWGSDLYLLHRAVKSSKRDKVCKQFRTVLGTYTILVKFRLFLSLLVRDLCVGVMLCRVRCVMWLWLVYGCDGQHQRCHSPCMKSQVFVFWLIPHHYSTVGPGCQLSNIS